VAIVLRLLIEGRPGAGKTTAVLRLAERLRRAGLPLAGFVTEELRERGRRVGFTVESLDGGRATLASVRLPGPPRVGRYGVDLAAFESIALPALRSPPPRAAVLIDELGKMELASEAFRGAVEGVLERPGPLVAAVQLARHPFTDAVKARPDVETVRLTAANRDQLPERIATRLLGG
jgi:nucleoside-triphosphatase